jgi:hypothetical protein
VRWEANASDLALGCPYADVAQLVERELPKLEVAGSRPVVRFPLLEPKIARVNASAAMSVEDVFKECLVAPQRAWFSRST